MLSSIQRRDGAISLPPGAEAVVPAEPDAMAIAEARIAERAATSPPWPDMEAFVARLKTESAPPLPAWAHSPCDVDKPRTYSFDTCEVPIRSPAGATAFVRATADYHPVDPNDIRQGSIGSPTPIADAQAGDRGRSPKGRVGRRG